MSSTQPQNPGAVLLTIKQAAAQLQISERTIFRLIEKGELNSISIGKSLRIHPEELERIAREGIRPRLLDAPINFKELNDYIHALPQGPLRYVVTALRDDIDRRPYDRAFAFQTALQLGGHIVDTFFTKQEAGKPATEDERLALKYIGLAVAKFSEGQKN